MVVNVLQGTVGLAVVEMGEACHDVEVDLNGLQRRRDSAVEGKKMKRIVHLISRDEVAELVAQAVHPDHPHP